MNSLGVDIDGERGVVVPSQKRLARVVRVLETILKYPFLSGKQLERLLGHITFIALLKRPFLSLLSACYAFARRHRAVTKRLWPSVGRELWHVCSLLPMCTANIRIPTSPIVYAGDSCRVGSATTFGGFGVCRAEWPRASASLHGKWSERWRFKHSLPGASRRFRDNVLQPASDAQGPRLTLASEPSFDVSREPSHVDDFVSSKKR